MIASTQNGGRLGSLPERNVFLFIPNIIGYVRVVLSLAAFYYMPTDYVIAGWCYFFSCFLDALDGYAARYFNQASMFGAVLDLITDRVISPIGLLTTLSVFYPGYSLAFQLFLIVDITSHWLHLHSAVLAGKKSHKSIDDDANAIMKLYYSNKTFLFSMAAGNELFFIAIYLLYFTHGPTVAGLGLFQWMAFTMAPVALFKTAITVLQLKIAVCKIASCDARSSSKSE